MRSPYFHSVLFRHVHEYMYLNSYPYSLCPTLFPSPQQSGSASTEMEQEHTPDSLMDIGASAEVVQEYTQTLSSSDEIASSSTVASSEPAKDEVSICIQQASCRSIIVTSS